MKTVNILICFIAALLATWIVTKRLIPYFRNKQLGQFIREEGPSAHLGKAGTPTMGGIAIIFGVIIGFVCSGSFDSDKLVIVITMLAFGLIGFIDDYEKIAKKNNLGITPTQKLALQFLFSIGIALYMVITKHNGNMIFIPFAKIYFSLGLFFIPFVIFVEVAMSNAVNLTDGLDGLASSVTLIVSIAFIAIGVVHKNEILIASGASLAGALIGFLFFNWSPAKIFMGDTGSMALGGLLSAIAIVTKFELILPIIGLIYVLEVLSVIIQVTYFKKTGGKRLFRMSPLHHHFELGGMTEKQVCYMFGGITLACCVLAFFAS